MDLNSAVAYIRVSTEEQNLGPEAQRAQIEAWAARQGVRIVSWHEDRISGGKPVEDRPGLLDALDSLRETRAGLLVAAKRDRIARDVVIAATVEAIAKQHGARVATADGVSYEDTPEGSLMRGLLDLFAQYERALIRARTKAALQAKLRAGQRLGRVPFGFRAQAGSLVRHDGEQALLARFRAMRADGLTPERMADIANSEGIPTGRSRKGQAGRWHGKSIRRILGA